MPGARRENSEGVLTIGNVSELELLAKIVIGLVWLVIEYHMDVIPHLGRFVHVGHVAFQVTRDLELDLYGRARHGAVGAWLDDLERRCGLVLSAASCHLVLEL